MCWSHFSCTSSLTLQEGETSEGWASVSNSEVKAGRLMGGLVKAGLCKDGPSPDCFIPVHTMLLFQQNLLGVK